MGGPRQVAWALALAATLLAGRPSAQAGGAGTLAHVASFEDLGLSLSLPAAWSVAALPPEGNDRASWLGRLGQTPLRIRFAVHANDEEGAVREPSQMMEWVGVGLAASRASRGQRFHFEELGHIPGPFGYAAYATYARSEGGEAATDEHRLAGLLSSWAYVLEIVASTRLSKEEAAQLRAALGKAIAYEGEVRDARWTKAEAESRWQADAPDDLRDEMDDVLRTAHYIVLTNSSGGSSFAKKMEACYVAVKKVYPFDEVPGRRLMPVFLFRTNDQYYEFCVKAFGMTLESARRTGGIASRDFYATWYEAPGDPVHVHEATHQIFANRLGLRGGGSWFQEGVAEYMSSRDNERGGAARAVVKGRHTPLADFFQLESLIFSSPANDISGANQSGDHYKYAALIVEFLREGKFGKAKFLDWVRAVGATRRNDLPAIEAAVQRVYGVDVAGLERELVAYCKKR